MLLANMVPGAEMHYLTKFNQTCSNHIYCYLYFSKWWLSGILVFEISKYYWLMESGGLRCTNVPDLIKIGQTVFEISCNKKVLIV